MKSHTNVYQYRCADCTYATKYCHSLKLHLRKYNHKPATILNTDGSLPMEDTKAQNELMKNRDRGPSTMPRPQLFKRLDMEPSMMLGPENGLHMMPGMNGSMIPPMYWPVLTNGLHQLPPPLMPLTNMVPIPSQLDRGLGRPLEHTMSTNNGFKCRLCCYDTDDRESLNKHMLKVHAAENQDLFSAFGITSDSLEDETRHNGDESHPRGSPPDSDKDALDLSKPMDLSKSPDVSPMPYSRKRRLLEHCLTPQFNRETSENVTEEPKPDLAATPPRKRSRKGKAFKLDTSLICMQEDGYNSPGVENDDFNRTEDFGYTSDETKDDESQKVPDFNEVSHDNLRKLNQSYTPQHRLGGILGDDIKSSFQHLNSMNHSIEAYRAEQERRDVVKVEPRAETETPALIVKAETREACIKHDSPYKPEYPYKMESPRHPSQNGVLSDNEDSASSGREDSSPGDVNLTNGHNINIKGDLYECQYCDIAFRDCILYTMHMGYHGYRDAFRCNSCGYQGKDKVDFSLHIARIAHV